MKLVFGKANAKLIALQNKMQELSNVKQKLATFSVLSGHTCPYAKDCLSKAVENSEGKRSIQDGPDTQFRCFSASQEAQYTGVYNSRKNNGEVVSLSAVSVDDAATAIESHIPNNTTIVRIHVGGDFKTQAYFDAWIEVAKRNPNILFYAYTKSLPFWVKRFDVLASIENFVLTASRGGHKDSLIETHKLREAVVVFSEAEAVEKGLEIDHDDSHAALPSLRNNSFALLLHGTQPPKSKASVALKALNGVGSYSKKK